MAAEKYRPLPETRSEQIREAVDRLDRETYLELCLQTGMTLIDDLDPGAMELTLTLLQATEVINYDLESAALRRFGFTGASFHLAYVIALCGNIEGSRLPAITNMSRANVSSIIKTLERNEIITKERAPRDARGMLLSITEAGFTKVVDAWAAVNKRESKWAERLNAGERSQLIKLLGKLSSRDDGHVKRRG